jgi:hypothetical protein
MNGWIKRLKHLHRRSEIEQGLNEEIQFHIEKQIEKNLKAGMQPDEARRQAMIKFGGVEQFKEYTRDQFRSAWLENFVRDLRHGARALRRTPGFTFVVIFTLALSIGAVTAMFTVLNGVVLRPLPYPQQDRLIELVHEAHVLAFLNCSHRRQSIFVIAITAVHSNRLVCGIGMIHL